MGILLIYYFVILLTYSMSSTINRFAIIMKLQNAVSTYLYHIEAWFQQLGPKVTIKCYIYVILNLKRKDLRLI